MCIVFIIKTKVLKMLTYLTNQSFLMKLFSEVLNVFIFTACIIKYISTLSLFLVMFAFIVWNTMNKLAFLSQFFLCKKNLVTMFLFRNLFQSQKLFKLIEFKKTLKPELIFYIEKTSKSFYILNILKIRIFFKLKTIVLNGNFFIYINLYFLLLLYSFETN